MSQTEKDLFLQWAIVTPETHTELFCVCPDCGASFSRWFQNHLVECDLDQLMHEQTTECSACVDERLDDEEWEEEEAELRAEEAAQGGE